MWYLACSVLQKAIGFLTTPIFTRVMGISDFGVVSMYNSWEAIHQHTSTRTNLTSFLCFVVLSGEGTLSYEEQTYQLGEGDCVFIDCRKAYSHSTSDNLWSLQWCHFYAPSLPAVYEKYKERGGLPVFHPADIEPFTTLLTDIYDLASSSDYIRDMRINEKLGSLLTLLMEQSWHPESMTAMVRYVARKH